MNSRRNICALLMLCCTLHIAAETNLTTIFSQQDPWLFMEYHFLQEPSQRVKSYRLRKFNIGMTTILWLISLFLSTKAKQLIACKEAANSVLQRNRGSYHELYAEQDTTHARKAAEEAKNLIAIIWPATFLVTLWTFYQSSYPLVRFAEQEIFGEILDNWAANKIYIPDTLIPVFEAALEMRKKKPKRFARELPELIKLIKEQTERHKKDAHYFAMSKSLEKLGNILHKS